jgi:serine O-acetyltransferase
MIHDSLSVERLPPVATASRERYSASVPDWSREAKSFWSWSPSRSLLASLRLHQRLVDSTHPWHALLRKIAVLRHRFWSIVTGADIPLGCRIGGGLQLPHPNGVVITATSCSVRTA